MNRNRLGAVPPDSRQNIRSVLLGCWNLRLYRGKNIRQVGVRPAILGDAREYPGAAFIIHQTPRAVDRVDYDAIARVIGVHIAGIDLSPVFQTFADDDDRSIRESLRKQFADQIFADTVDRVDGVATRLRRHGA